VWCGRNSGNNCDNSTDNVEVHFEKLEDGLVYKTNDDLDELMMYG
jgi:hypothetical protein